jgi:hypothetical protein
MTKYTIRATYKRDGQVLECSQAEVLGDAYGRTYWMREEAEREAEQLQDELHEYPDLDQSTTYSVHEEEIDLESIAREWALTEPAGTTPEILDGGLYDDMVREALGLRRGGQGETIPAEAWAVVRREYERAVRQS